jgi:hypothetical protein
MLRKAACPGSIRPGCGELSSAPANQRACCICKCGVDKQSHLMSKIIFNVYTGYGDCKHGSCTCVAYITRAYVCKGGGKLAQNYV